MSSILLAGAYAVAPIVTAGALFAQATAPTTATSQPDVAGPLRIHVTAVQGGAQFRPNPQSKWISLTADVDLPEGVEIRTGPKGAVQFIVGSDQVYRVDRLTSVKLLRAALLPDGTIKTDVGMEYGRVSKDIDAALHPHSDTIITPNSTLAVRGTRVSLYDQPPYAPEAVSLTGAAVYTNIHGLLVKFGAKGAGTAKLNADSRSAAAYRLQTEPLDPKGAFAARTIDQQTLAQLPALGSNDLGVFSQIQGQIATKDYIASFAVVGSGVRQVLLQFMNSWTNSFGSKSVAANFPTVVDFSIKAPNGIVFNMATPSNSSESYTPGSSNTYSPTYGGMQEIDFSSFNAGTYTITATLDQTTLNLKPKAQVNASITVMENPPNVGIVTTSNSGTQTADNILLNHTNPTAVFQTVVPSSAFIPNIPLQFVSGPASAPTVAAPKPSRH